MGLLKIRKVSDKPIIWKSDTYIFKRDKFFFCHLVHVEVSFDMQHAERSVFIISELRYLSCTSSNGKGSRDQESDAHFSSKSANPAYCSLQFMYQAWWHVMTKVHTHEALMTRRWLTKQTIKSPLKLSVVHALTINFYKRLSLESSTCTKPWAKERNNVGEEKGHKYLSLY